MTALRSLPMSLMVGLVHRDGGRRVASRRLDDLAERTSGATVARVTRPGLALVAAGETTRVEESAG